MSAGFTGGVATELGTGIADRLAVLEEAACGLRAPGQIEQLRLELLHVVTMWRRALRAHLPPGGAGRCPVCRFWWRPARWPCPVWRAAQLVLLDLDAGAAVGPETSRHAAPPARGRHARSSRGT